MELALRNNETILAKIESVREFVGGTQLECLSTYYAS